MARKRYPPTDPREWLNRARSNLAIARSDTVGALLEDLCFESQQAAEKAIKAVFVHRGARFPYVHDLDELLNQLEGSGLKIPKYVRQADELSPFAVVMRTRDLSTQSRKGNTVARSASPRPFSAGPSDRLAIHNLEGSKDSLCPCFPSPKTRTTGNHEAHGATENRARLNRRRNCPFVRLV